MNVLKFFILLAFISVDLFSQKVEITSEKMYAKDLEKKVRFDINVFLKDGDSWLQSDVLIVNLNQQNEVQDYEATGSVSFVAKENMNFYVGKAQRVNYYPSESKYYLYDNAVVDDKINNSHVEGDEIVIDLITGKANVVGKKKKPVKFIIEME